MNVRFWACGAAGFSVGVVLTGVWVSIAIVAGYHPLRLFSMLMLVPLFGPAFWLSFAADKRGYPGFAEGLMILLIIVAVAVIFLTDEPALGRWFPEWF